MIVNIPQAVLIRLANAQHKRISKLITKWPAEKKMIVARRKCEKLKVIFDIKFEFGRILFMNKNNVPYGITPQELMNRILKKYIEMVQLGQVYPNQKTDLEMSEFAAYYAIWYTNSEGLKNESQRVILDRLVKQILPPNKLTEPNDRAKVYNRLFKEASLILPTTTDKQIKNLKKSCESKVSRYIDKIKRDEL